MRFIYRIIISLLLQLVTLLGFCQKAINLNLNFDTTAKGAFVNQIQNNYYIDTYTPKKKDPIGIYSSRLDTPYYKYYSENIFPEPDNIKHGLYIGITLYRKSVYSARELFIIKLDTLLQKGISYKISYDAKYHQFTNYRIDSLQVLFIEQEKDIKLFLEEKLYKGMHVDFSLKNIDNKVWQKIGNSFITESNYSYMIIGNLKPDNETVVTKVNNCKCIKQPKGFWDYSELFLDNFLIVEQ